MTFIHKKYLGMSIVFPYLNRYLLATYFTDSEERKHEKKIAHLVAGTVVEHGSLRLSTHRRPAGGSRRDRRRYGLQNPYLRLLWRLECPPGSEWLHRGGKGS